MVLPSNCVNILNQNLDINRNFIVQYFPYFLFCYHLVFPVFAFLFVQEIGGDALNYWFVGKNLENASWLNYVIPGTNVINMITFPLVKYFHLPLWCGFLLFSLFSYIGFYKLWNLIVTFTQNSKIAFFIGIVLMLLPNLHLWTSFIGKESIIFVALMFIIEKIIKKKMRSSALISSFVFIALIRPHVTIVLFLAFLLAYFWKGDLSKKSKWLLLGVATIASIPLYFILKKIAKIKDNAWDRILHIYDYHIIALRKTNSYVPLDEYPLPYKLFTFYFRPLPFEKTGLLYQIWCVENIILLLITLGLLSFVVVNIKKLKWDFFFIFATFTIVLLGIMYVYAYANYGLIARTKIMAMPFFYILVVKIIAQNTSSVLTSEAQREF